MPQFLGLPKQGGGELFGIRSLGLSPGCCWGPTVGGQAPKLGGASPQPRPGLVCSSSSVPRPSAAPCWPGLPLRNQPFRPDPPGRSPPGAGSHAYKNHGLSCPGAFCQLGPQGPGPGGWRDSRGVAGMPWRPPQWPGGCEGLTGRAFAGGGGQRLGE